MKGGVTASIWKEALVLEAFCSFGLLIEGKLVFMVGGITKMQVELCLHLVVYMSLVCGQLQLMVHLLQCHSATNIPHSKVCGWRALHHTAVERPGEDRVPEVMRSANRIKFKFSEEWSVTMFTQADTAVWIKSIYCLETIRKCFKLKNEEMKKIFITRFSFCPSQIKVLSQCNKTFRSIVDLWFWESFFL